MIWKWRRETAGVVSRGGFFEVTNRGKTSTSVFSSDDEKWHLAFFILSKQPRLVLTNGESVAVFSRGETVFHSAGSNAGVFAVTCGEDEPRELHVLFPDGRRAALDGIDFRKFSFSQFPQNDMILEIVYKDDSRETVDLSEI